MDKEEAIFTLRKNKLDLEHEELLQDRNLLVVTQFGIPFTIINIFVAVKFEMNIYVGVGIAGVIFLGFMEFFRRQNTRKIKEKRSEIDSYIKQLEKIQKSSA